MPFPAVRCQARVWIATIIGGVLLALGSDSGARAVQGAPPAATAPLTTTLPLDTAVTQGRLDNGLRYILRANKQPLGRAELRLVVNAGSVLEADDQRGLAHFVEHMAFNGTRNFPKQEAIAFLQSLGMRAGPSINATTSYDETVYALQIPTDAPAVMDRALLILADWAHAITFDPAEVDKERGVIIEEWRLRRNATARMLDLQFPVLLKGSRYADRRPIGTVESLKTFPHARLKDFYTTWYRPDLMAVIGVGDFDPRAMQDLIRKRLGVIPAVKTPLSRPSYVVPAQIGTQYSAATDKEATGATVTVYAKRPVPAQLTVGEYRAEIVARLAAAMVSHRLTGVAQQPNSPLLSANATQGRVVRSGQAAIVNAGLRENLIERGLVALFGELERIARDGLTPEELERQKTIMLRGFELAVAQREARSSAQLAAEYVRLFTIDEPSPGLAYESDLIQRFVPQMTLAEVNAAARAWTVADNRVVLVNAPEKAGVVIPDAGRFAGMLKALGSASLPAYVARANNQPLIDAPPPAGTIVKTTTNAALGITEWELSNGLKVVIRPTTFKEDEVLFGAVESWRNVARARRGHRPRANGGTGGDLTGCRTLRERGSAPGAHREGRHGPARHQHVRRRADGRRIAQGSRDDLSAHLSDGHSAAPRPDHLQLAPLVTAVGACQPGGDARLRVCVGADGSALARPSAGSPCDAADGRGDEHGPIDRLLQGSFC